MQCCLASFFFFFFFFLLYFQVRQGSLPRWELVICNTLWQSVWVFWSGVVAKYLLVQKLCIRVKSFTVICWEKTKTIPFGSDLLLYSQHYCITCKDHPHGLWVCVGTMRRTSVHWGYVWLFVLVSSFCCSFVCFTVYCTCTSNYVSVMFMQDFSQSLLLNLALSSC